MAETPGRCYLLLVLAITFTNFYIVCCDFPFRNISLSWSERVNDLVGRLTLEEIVDQLAKGGAGKGGPAPAIPRLGIKPHQWNNECLRGVVWAGNATAFPQALGLAAAFSPELIFNISRVTGIEARAKYNDHIRKGEYGDHTGISCFSPVINIVRHPFWGRTQETYGEDPYLSGVYAAHFVYGLQGDNPRYVLANAGCKHFDVHGGPENIPVSRLSFDAKVAERDWRLTFLPAFKACVKAGTYSIMCSYNRINGIPACANKLLLTDILRNEWDFKGYVISDEGALEFIISYHKYLNNSVDTAAACVNAGTNIELSPNLNGSAVFMSLGKAIAQGKVTKETAIERLKPLVYTRMRLGEFDSPALNPYSSIPMSVIQSAAHRQLSLQAAMQSFVLLKNEDGFLPLKGKIKTLAIVGPFGDNRDQIFGDYSPTADPKFISTPLSSLEPMATQGMYAPGCTDTHCNTYNSSYVKEAVFSADLVIVCLGTGQAVETEGHDRASLDLPGKQLQLLKDAVSGAGQNVPVILLLFNAGPVDVTWAKNTPQVMAIIECFFPAQETGEAVRRVLWNDGIHANPGGRLPVTWPADNSQIPPITNYTMEGRTYRYFKGDPLYPFGYGLSYTTFQYSNLKVTDKVKAGANISVTMTVKNTGKYDGDEVTQVYMKWTNTPVKMPQLQLVGFNRVFVPKNGIVSQKYTITAEQYAVWDDKEGFVVLPGTLQVYVGGQQPGQKTQVPSNILKSTVTIVKD